MDNAPIGIFDSGLGGLTVARAIIDKLPDEGVIYLGDTAHTPYGPRPLDEVRDLTLAGLDSLVEHGVKMLVIACNTGTAAALSAAHSRYWEQQRIPVIEVISPAAREARTATRNGRVGVIGTEATVASGAYIRALAPDDQLQVFSQACPQFVDFVERGVTTGTELTEVTREYLRPLQDQGVDTVILGCTHYPLLTGVISLVLGPNVRLVSSSEATANVVYSQLVELDLLHEPRPGGRPEPDQYRFLSTNDSSRFPVLARRFLGPEVQSIEAVKVHGG